ncbi:dihydroorotase [candidate division KSB1 bacterium]|nr:dihydroorotase [candidate division KSB1 bacterium]
MFKTVESLLLINGIILDLDKNQQIRANIFIKNGIIQEISTLSPENFDGEIVNVQEQIVVPGLIDMHVHFRDPGFEAKETLLTGANAAMAGGFTQVCTMPNTSPATDSPNLIRKTIQQMESHLVQIHPVATITKGRRGEELADMPALAAAGASGFSDDGSPVMNAEIMRQALLMSKKLGKPVIEHCEDINLVRGGAIHEGMIAAKLEIPGITGASEDVMVARNIILAEETGGLLHIAHISTARSVALVREAKKRGISVTCEATPHHFVLTDATVERYGTNAKMNPPLRTQADVDAVREGLADGTIDVIASDHAPHTSEEKNQPLTKAPFGIVGLETMLPLVFTYLVEKKVLTLVDAIKKMTIFPARILGLEVPAIKVGMKANLTIFDPQAEWRIDRNQFKSKGRNTPFHDWLVSGKASGVVRGDRFHWRA